MNISESSKNGRIRNSNKPGNRPNTLPLREQVKRIKSKAGGDPAMFGQKSESFIKVFLAGRTMISAFTVMKEGMFSHKGRSLITEVR